MLNEHVQKIVTNREQYEVKALRRVKQSNEQSKRTKQENKASEQVEICIGSDNKTQINCAFYTKNCRLFISV
ncbi:hypothetical protein BCAMP_12040 [Brochothrix campestris FSL F6-1037]|uniref:Uncharacterized protein n=1 Tax=Brochothrix campestris FSL F6-1037 TaxID=1265861 RepID=W7CDI7_9LIST|nr:hypothetical protein BCAMP_12040 [Brochothrix campestris FSL F6-1037]